jgi:integrase
MKEMSAAAKVGEITRDTRLRDVIDLWLEDLDHQVAHDGKAPTTARTYRSYLTGHILPQLGALRLREVTPAACDTRIKTVRREMGYESAKKVKSILSAVADFAIRRGAVDWVNPTKAVEAMTAGVAEDVVAMTVDQVVTMLQGMRDYAVERDNTRDGRAAHRNMVWHDLPELAEAMLATGVRIGEVLALRGEDIIRGDDGRLLVSVDAHLIFVTGEGTRYVSGRKGGQPGLLLEVPAWSHAMFLRRKIAAGPGPLFPSLEGGWSDTNNVNKRIRKAMDACGFDWVTSHVWRHTVGTLLDEADLPVSDVAGQLGNTKAVAERHYIRRRATNQRAAAALEVLGRKVAGS